MSLRDSLNSVKVVGSTIGHIENPSETLDNPTVLAGGHDSTAVDSGHLLGEDDAAPNSALIDADVDSAPRENREDAPVRVSALPESFNFLPGEMGNQPLLDADILSGSYGANYLIAAELGPDGIGNVVWVTAPLSEDDPASIRVLDTTFNDFLV